jgi:hypothetical protein
MDVYPIACVLAFLPLPIGGAIALLASRGAPSAEAPASVTLVRIVVPFWTLFTLTLCVPGQASFVLDAHGAARGLVLVPAANACVAVFVLVAGVRLTRRATGAIVLARRAALTSLGFHGLVLPVGIALFFAALATAPGRDLNVDDLPGALAALAVAWLLPGLAIAGLLLAASRHAVDA